MPPSAVICFAGPRDRYQSALALQEHQALEALVTEAYFSKFWAETRLFGRNFHRFAKVRHHPEIPATKAVRSLPAFVQALQARFNRRKDSPHFAAADRQRQALFVARVTIAALTEERRLVDVPRGQAEEDRIRQILGRELDRKSVV